MSKARKILITGACGYLGQETLGGLRQEANLQIVGLDVQKEACFALDEKVVYINQDIRDAQAIDRLFSKESFDCVVHLASIVNPPPGHGRQFAYEVDVQGTRNLLEAAVQHGVQQFVVTSSGAAYGYHADHPEWLSEDQPLRGNYEFAYSHHKKLVEEMLAEYRKAHPQLAQLILRPGTILGENVSNQITDLFENDRILVLRGSDTPFVFIWDRDVVEIIRKGVLENKSGIFNLAGDGFLTLPEIARRLNKPLRRLPVWLVQLALGLLKLLRITRYGPEQVRFLLYRPVLANDALKKEFGYTPRRTSAEVFELYQRARHAR